MSGFEGKAASFLEKFSQALYTNPPAWLNVNQLPVSADQSFLDAVNQSISALPQSKIRAKLLDQIDACAKVILQHLQTTHKSSTNASTTQKKRKHESINQSTTSENTQTKKSLNQSIKSLKLSLSTDSSTFLTNFRSLYRSITSRAHPSSHSQQALILSKMRHLFLVDRSTDDIAACLLMTRASPVTFPVHMRQQVVDMLLQQSSKQANNQSVSFLHAVSVALAALFKSRCSQSSFSLVHELTRLRSSLAYVTPFPLVGPHPQVELSFLLELLDGESELNEQQLVDVINALKDDVIQSFMHSSAAHFDRHVALLTCRLALVKSQGKVLVTLKSFASRLAATVSFPADLIEGYANASAWLLRGVDGKATKQQSMIDEIELELTSIRSLQSVVDVSDDEHVSDVDMQDGEDSSSLHIQINSLIDESHHDGDASNDQSINQSNDMESMVIDLADTLGPDVSSPPRSRQRQSLQVDASNNQSNNSDEPDTPLSASHLSAPRERSRSRSRSRSPARMLRSNTSPKRTRAGTQFGDILA